MAQAALDLNKSLAEDMASFERRPWDFVLYAFPWGKGPLKDKYPEPWQEELLKSIQSRLEQIPNDPDAIWSCIVRELRVSGHGIGKSSLIAWLIMWGLSTMPLTRGVVTANTEPQLRTKTVPEVTKWFYLCITSHWFTITATAIFSRDPTTAKTWRVDFIPWNEHNPESFQGLHNAGRRILIIFDEASAIADSIWDAVEGALTDMNTQIIFCTFGNPTRLLGRFAEIIKRQHKRWNVKPVDARDVSITNKEEIEEWKDEHGEDSNYFRIKVRGVLPKTESDVLIAMDWIEAALKRKLEPAEPKIISCDVARFGDDDTVIGLREGQTYRELDRYMGNDLMKTAGRLKAYWDDLEPDHIVVDDVGLGGGVTDRLTEQEVDVRAYNGGASAYEDTRFYNRRSESWYGLRELFRKEEISLDVDDEDDMIAQLIGPTYSYMSDRRIRLEPKEKMKKRMKSPDRGDALVMAFAPDSLIIPL